jgi:hypothetical protein
MDQHREEHVVCAAISVQIDQRLKAVKKNDPDNEEVDVAVGSEVDDTGLGPAGVEEEDSEGEDETVEVTEEYLMEIDTDNVVIEVVQRSGHSGQLFAKLV